jgi:photosystem II stability/assembly factor-like uncharacterized protein
MKMTHLSIQEAEMPAVQAVTGRQRNLRSMLGVILPLFLIVFLVLLSACASNNSSSPSTPQVQNINGFGTAANHGHSLVALSDHTLLLATHFGLFRSPDSGKTWSGPNQTLGQMMTSSLSVSPLNNQRVYMLVEHSLSVQSGTVGLYTSTDEGKGWQLAISANTTGQMFTAVAGNRSPDEVYAYVATKGADGLLVSEDAGKHFKSPGVLPFGRILGILPVRNVPGTVLVYGTDGAALSTDAGAHWAVVKGFVSAVYSMAMGGPGSPIYASSEAGMYVSQDGGKSFQHVSTESRNALTAVADEPQWLYGKTGQQVYKSIDGGHTWKALPDIKGNLQDLAPDPRNGADLYLSLSYPTAIYLYTDKSSSWISLTPRA